MSLDENSLDSFYAYSESKYETLKKSDTNEIIFHFVGDLNTGFANAISAKLEKLVEEKVTDKQARKRFYTVYIEAIQNIRIHSADAEKKKEILAGVTVYTNEDKLCAEFLNLIPTGNTDSLLEKYSEINALNRKELKQRYMSQMVDGDLSEKGGAGLGIITIVLRSQNKSDVKVVALNKTYTIFQSLVCVDCRNPTEK